MFDIAGILILVALTALFGFLTTRAWKLKRPFLKWGGVVVCGLLTALPALLLVWGLSGFAKLNEQHTNPVADVKVAGTADQIARGERLAQLCVSCHTPGSQLPLTGSDMLAKFPMPPVGTLYAPNLTPNGEIHDWSDGEIIRAIREGVHRSGRSLLVMPSDVFRNLSDDDVQALVAYLRSQPAAGTRSPDNHFNLFGALFLNLFDFRTAQQPIGSVTSPQPGTPEYGKYLVSVIECQSCHGDKLQGKVDTGTPGPPPGPNLTRIIPSWTEAQFMTFFNTGQLPDGSTVPTVTLPSGYSSPRMPWSMVRAAASDDDLRAMYAYLHSLPLVDGPTK